MRSKILPVIIVAFAFSACGDSGVPPWLRDEGGPADTGNDSGRDTIVPVDNGQDPGPDVVRDLPEDVPFDLPDVAPDDGIAHDDGITADEGVTTPDAKDAVGEDVYDVHDTTDTTADTVEADAGCTRDQECGIPPDLKICETMKCFEGSCVRENLPDLDSCEDGSVCTTNDKCSAGDCVGTPINCDDGNICTSDYCVPSAGCAHSAKNNIACDDGNSCTANDRCSNKVCSGTAMTCNTPPGAQCNQNGTAAITYSGPGSCSGGQCVYGQTTTPCPAGCLNGQCLVDPCAGIVCNTPPNSCYQQTGTCSGGNCSYLYNNSGTCTDGNPCTVDTCVNGTCTSAQMVCNTPPPRECDSDGTTLISYRKTGSCSGGTCIYQKTLFSCVNGCVNGACSGDPCGGVDCTEPPSQCLKSPGTCVGGDCVWEPDNGAACTDGNACTENDSCVGTTCSGTEVVCDDFNMCTAEYCDIVEGCVFQSDNLCNDNKVCTDDTCNPLVGCINTNNTAACEDGSVCTVNDVCQGGTCVPGPAADCSDNNVCTDDVCDMYSGCDHINNTSVCRQAACVGLTFKPAATCAGGSCQYPADINCNDNNPCTSDLCDPATGCINAYNTDSCSDGNACTTGDVCSFGECAGTPVVCNDPPDDYCTDNTVHRHEAIGTCSGGSCGYDVSTFECTHGCTAGRCDGDPCEGVTCNTPPNGCYLSAGTCSGGACTYPYNNNASCSDNNECTVGDKCLDGTCSPGSTLPCDDSNPCTDNSCNPATGCVFTNNTATCSDNDACTDGDVCRDGTCRPGNALNCDDVNDCTSDSCDRSTGCVNGKKPNNTTCEDTDPCTSTGTCQGGFCITFAKVCNDDNTCTDDSCNPSTGCVFTNNSDTCNDSNACTENDYCSGGSCLPGTPRNCNDNNECTDDSCNQTTGCVNAFHTRQCVQQGCSGLVFQAAGYCLQGSCDRPLTVNCDDGIGCTVDTCDAVTGCGHVPDAGLCPDDGNVCTDRTCDPEEGCGLSYNTAACDDFNLCTVHDTCSSGTCSGTAYTCPTLACAVGSCNGDNGCSWEVNPGWCVIDSACYPALAANPENECLVCSPTDNHLEWTPRAGDCNDGDLCTEGDVCLFGQCMSGASKTCGDGNICTTDSCAPASGCVFTPNTLTCSDGNECTIDDTCNGGLCLGTTRNCDDGNQCTVDTCDQTAGCEYEYYEGACSDGDECTVGDWCLMDMCASSGTKNCSDGNQCTTDGCASATGCYHNVVPNNTGCEDNNPCTSGDKCVNGYCGGEGLNCDDEDPCTDDSCNLAEYKCTYTFNTAACSDNNKCTVNDTCANGSCVAGSLLTCNDNNPCTTDTCNPATGCVFTPNTDACNDNNPCTTDDRCSAGSCIGGPALVCNDDNQCTDDRCINPTGCVFTPMSRSCDDGNACTYGDFCNAGQCTGQSITCTAYLECTTASCDGTSECSLTVNSGWCVIGGACVAENATAPGNACLYCNPASSVTAWTSRSGMACDDGIACTSFDHCVDGTCTGTSYSCNDNLACTSDSCDGNGGCSNIPVAEWCAIAGSCVAKGTLSATNPCLICNSTAAPTTWSYNNGASCSDGDNCTVNDTCSEGTCVAGESRNCDDNNPCTDNLCESSRQGGCVNQPIVAICALSRCEGLTYYAAAMCVGGLCPTQTGQNCNDNNPCTTDQCTATGCVNTPNTGSCDDGNACTHNDVCGNGVCRGTAYTCSPSSDCVLSSACNGLGGCTETPKPVGTVCASDGNPCTRDVCGNGNAVCEHPAATDGTQCNDNNLCTSGDTCLNGSCSNGNDVVCQPLDTCHVAGVCDPATGLCSNPLKGNGESCDDGNACTSGDVCTDGSCSGPIVNNCPAPDTCHDNGSCNPSTGVCTYPTKPDGSTCNDSNLCTTRDLCSKGSCRGLDPVTCSPIDSCHYSGVCEPSTGVCSTPPKPDNTTCDDGNACTSGTFCLSGSCQGGTAKTCPATNNCHYEGVCNTSTGVCSNPVKPDNTECDDGASCTKLDHCVSGTCVGTTYSCYDGKSCTTDTCAGDGTCQFPVIDNWCLIGAVCRSAGQVNTTNTCQICNPAASKTDWSPNQGATCNDGRQDTMNDVCTGTVCAGTPYSCSDGLDCTDDICDGQGSASHTIVSGYCVIEGACYANYAANPANSCQRCRSTINNQAWTSVDNGLACDDGNACSYSDKCASGTCAGTTYSCDDGLACTVNTCMGDGNCSVTIQTGFCAVWNSCIADGSANPINSCQACDSNVSQIAWTATNEGLACDDGNTMTTDDACVQGDCIGAGVSCVDGLDCTDDVPTPGGCTNPIAGGWCMIDGACVYDGNTDPTNRCQVCDADNAPTEWSPNDGSTCSDNDDCTTDDVCQLGVCSGTPVSCNDNKACTEDTCSGGQCEFAVKAGWCLIGGACVADGTINPENTCEKCNPAVLAVNWSSNDGASCGDADACTRNDVCYAGICRGTAYSCDDGRTCTADSCDGAGGCTRDVLTGYCLINGNCLAEGATNTFNVCQVCSHASDPNGWTANDGATCNDGNSCTFPDTCSGDTCQGTAKPCDDGLACTTDVCNGTGGCGTPVLNPGWCLIGNVCYANREVNPSNPCLMCKPESTTGEWSFRDGVFCDDSNACTAFDTCESGVCGGTSYGCSDGIACTVDTCDGLGGCDHSGITAGTCRISGACFADGDRQSAGSCQGCVAATSQTQWTDLDNTTCSDGNLCTFDDTCRTGACVGTDHPCDDGVECTDNVCDGNGGCSFPLSTDWCRIGGECQAAGQKHPTDTCSVCAPTISQSQWTSQDPGNPEVCNGADDNCDGNTDPEDSPGCTLYYLDSDQDGVGVATGPRCLCGPEGLYTAISAGDCDDANPTARPGISEVCDGIDNDCDNLVDEQNATGCTLYYYDQDNDGYGQNGTGRCLCDVDGLHRALVDGDCSDASMSVNPEGTEICNGIDDNCDGFTDPDGVTGCAVRYADQDQDGFGAGTGICMCNPRGVFTAANDTDCDDANTIVKPGAVERCNLADDDCDGQIDNGQIATLCPLDAGVEAHGTSTCTLGTCALACDVFNVSPASRDWYDMDGRYSTGCECQADQYQKVTGFQCSNAVDLGTIPDDGSTVTVNGNVPENGLEDWFVFTASDPTWNAEPDNADLYHASAVLTSGGGEFEITIIKGTCGGETLCSSGSEFEWYTDFTSPALGENPCAPIGNDCENPTDYDECIRITGDVDKCGPCPALPSAGFHQCTDNTATYLVRVKRRSGLPVTCNGYTLTVGNGPGL